MQLELFQDYLNREISLIPLIRGTKVPVFSWKKYQYQRAKEETVKRWVEKGYNLGIVGGDISGLVMIDADAHLHELKTLVPETEETAHVKTPNGDHYHYYFNTAENFVFTNSFLGLDHVELRSAGHQCVAPDSVVNGIPYTWEIPLDHILPFPDRFYDASILQDDRVPPACPPFRRGRERSCIIQIFERDISPGERDHTLFTLYNLLRRYYSIGYARAFVEDKNRSLAFPQSSRELEKVWYDEHLGWSCRATKKYCPFIKCGGCGYAAKRWTMKKVIQLKNLDRLTELSSSEKVIVLTLDSYFDGGRPPSITKLSELSGIDWRIAKRAMDKLEHEKWLP